MTIRNAGELRVEALTHACWDSLGKVYEKLNVLGYTIDQQRLQGRLPTEDQMRMQYETMQEFYDLLVQAGSEIDGPLVQDVL